MAGADQAESVEERRPYPGLRFYDDDRKELFAGRDAEIKDCAAAIRDSRVLILHGRTGCGKSSFLRAGVKPYLSRTGSSINFADSPGGLPVIRSTGDPLGAFGNALIETAAYFANEETDGKAKFGERAADVSAAMVAKAFPDDEAFKERLRTDADEAFGAMKRLARFMKTPPVFMIDQAEEVFTLKRRLVTKADIEVVEASEFEADNKAAKANSDAARAEVEAAEARDYEYFRFLHMVASEDNRAHIVVSLRTEYKGQFDDKIVHFGHPGDRLKGFYLPDLDIEGLTEAILRPTLPAGPKWEDIKRRLGLPPDAVAPGDAAGALSIPHVVARVIAMELLSESVPAGGILPTLQATCIRLWNQSVETRKVQRRHVVRIADLRRLGAVNSQVEQYLQECIDDACSGVRKWRANLPEYVTRWLREIRSLMVTVEADGRAVTRSIPYKDLIARLDERISVDVADASDVIKTVAKLLEPDVGILKNEAGVVTLGHDSLALALHTWALSAPRESASMMMRMGMVTTESLSKLEITDLFLREEQPHKTDIIAPEDFNWDRQLPHFAAQRGFAQRLGINIRKPAELSALEGVVQKRQDWNWAALRADIIAREEAWPDNRLRWDKDNERVMVAADVGAFPGKPPEVVEFTPEGRRKDPRAKYAWRWSDVLVTNLFLGNALIGPDRDIAEGLASAMRVRDASKTDEALVQAEVGEKGRFAEALEGAILSSLRSVLAAGGDIRCADESGREMLVFAATLCGDEALAETFRTLKTIESGSRDIYRVRDPLVEFLLGAKDGAKRYIIGPAASRALARQCGFHVYFGAQELAIIANKEMKRRQTADYDIMIMRESRKPAQIKRADAAEALEAARRETLPDLAEAVQKIVTHTVWHVGVQAANWKQGLNRAFVLRYASIGYFTSEYVRTSMDDFVGYIQKFVNDTYEKIGRRGDSMRGQKLTRAAIKDAIAECYKFLKFDEFGPSVFDLDSLYAYWSDHGHMQTRSVAGEVYAELVSLRRQTLAHYMICAEAIAWMRYGGSYNPSDKDISDAYRLKELAWNNFNIYNFYDAERYMARAADTLQLCVERDFSERPD